MQAMNTDDLNSLVGKSLGPFRIVERIGAGGMATVFKAYHPTLDRYVAIKVLPAYHARDPVFKERFAREARTVAKLAHPNIVQIHDFGEQDGITYIVMEYVDDGTLKDRLKQRLTGLPVPETVDFMIQAAEGLGCAHRNGIVHRDIKPSNMLLRKNGQLLISDFGIAKILEATNLTRVGTGIGTPQYMSPEQATGQPVDRRSDIYSLGIVMFHCLMGRVPFSAESPVGITVKHLNEPLPVQQLQMANVPAPLEQIVGKMTAKSPQDRYQTMEALVAALKGMLIEWPRAPWPVSGPLPPPGQGAFPALRSPEAQQSEVTVTCFRCGASNPSSRLFCISCGYDLADKTPTPDLYRGPNGRPILARLTLQNGQNVGRSYLFHQVMTTIGRTNANNLVISGRTVSRRHARLWFDNGQWFLEDLQSANGTSVNNMRISYQPIALKDGDIINFGDEVVLFNEVFNEYASLPGSTTGAISSPEETKSVVRTQEIHLSLFAIAHAELGGRDIAFVRKIYSVQAGISQSKPEKFEGEPFDLSVSDIREPLPFDILLHASENIELLTAWHKHLRYNPHDPEPQLVEFTFWVVAPGLSSLDINFYHERRWLRTIHLEFDAVEQSRPASVSAEG